MNMDSRLRGNDTYASPPGSETPDQVGGKLPAYTLAGMTCGNTQLSLETRP